MWRVADSPVCQGTFSPGENKNIFNKKWHSVIFKYLTLGLGPVDVSVLLPAQQHVHMEHSYVSCTNKSSTLRLLRAASCCCLPRGWLLHLLETGQQQCLQRTLGFTSCCSQTERKKIFMRKIIFDEGMKIPKKK